MLPKSKISKAVISLSLIAIITLFAWSIFIFDLNYIYPGDWTEFLGQYEAIRRSVVDFHQFPFWHPWHTGGTPLFAQIDLGFFSIDTLCVLIFGTVAGLKISIIIHIIIGAIGMYYLLSNYTKNELVKFWGTLLFTLQGTLAIHIAAGHINMISIVWLPWIFLLSYRIKDSLTFSLLFALILSIVANEGIHYVAVIVMLFAGILIFIHLVKNFRNKIFIYHLLLISTLFLTLSFYRLFLAFSLAKQFPREIDISVIIPFWRYLYGLFYPAQSILSFKPMLNIGGSNVQWFWHEFGCYIGIISVLFFFLSFVKGIKWWHIGAFITLLIAFDSQSSFLPGHWLRLLPIFKSMWVITRWRFFVLFFVIIGASVGLEFLIEKLRNKNKVINLLPIILIVISILGLIYNQFYNWDILNKYKIHAEKLISSVKIQSDTIVTSGIRDPFSKRLDFPCVNKGIGLIYSYENILGYSTNYNSARIPIEAKEKYKGEIYPLDNNKLDINWTPNKIFIDAKNKGRIWINQNPGNYWYLNGKHLFPTYKAFEMDKIFILNLPKGGKYILEAIPPFNNLLIVFNFVILSIFIISFILYKKNTN